MTDNIKSLVERATALTERYHAEITQPGEIDWGKHADFASEAIDILGEMIAAPVADSAMAKDAKAFATAVRLNFEVYQGTNCDRMAAFVGYYCGSAREKFAIEYHDDHADAMAATRRAIERAAAAIAASAAKGDKA